MTEAMSGPAPGSVAPRVSLDRVLAELSRQGVPVPTPRASGVMVSCPLHDETTPSMHVTWQPGRQGGYTLLHCFGCQARAEDLVVALGLTMADLFDEPLPDRDKTFTRVGKSPQQRMSGHRRGRLGRLPALITRSAAVAEPVMEHRWREVTRYPYVDLRGALVQEVIREECTAEGDLHKQFRQEFITANGRRVRRKPDGFAPVLYRAPQIRAAITSGTPVWLLEGEKDVATAETLGLVATTNTQGGKAFPDDLVDCLRGADVFVVLDRDPTGWARGVELHQKLTGVAAKVRLLLPIPDHAKADFTDHVEAGHGVNDLIDVDVEEVATWHAYAAAVERGKLLRQAVAEAAAHLERVEAGEDVETHRKHAQRWALETQVRHEALRELADRVHGHGLRVGTVWAGAAMLAADQLVTESTEQARRCHHQAGVAVPAALRPAAATEAETSSGDRVARTADDTAGFTANDRGLAATSPVFRELHGQIVQWDPTRGQRRDDNSDDPEDDSRCKVILTTVVKVAVREYLEVEEAAEVDHVELLGRASTGRRRVQAPRQLVAVRLQYADPITGESMEIRVAADHWRDHSWLESLPGPVDYDHKRAGLDTLQRAILAISSGAVDEVLYRATGWREGADGSFRFIHRRGAVTATGHEDLEVAFSGAMERYDLPDPIRDPLRLRQAFLEHSAGMMQRLPDRVAAPLLGQVYRAVLGHNPWVLTLVGPPGSYKTSIAAKVMQHFGERWDQSKPASSMSGNGDTFNTLRFKLHNAKDTLYWMDDFAPTKSWLEAQKNLEETTRLVHNQEERGRTARDGLSITAGTPPRASGLCTSEVMPRAGSGAERMLVVPLAREDVDPTILFPLDAAPSRHARAVVMASFISWLAEDLRTLRAWYLGIAEDYADQLTAAGETIRQAAALAQTWIGWVAITDFMVMVGAISAPERAELLRRVDVGLREAGKAAVNPDMPRTTGARVLELLQYALGQGIAYTDDVRTGDCPPWPLASRLGWRRQILEHDGDGHATRTRYERMGLRLGYVLHDPDLRERGRVLMCDSTQLEAALKAATATQAEKLEIDRNTAMRALAEIEVLIRDTSEGRTRFTTKCRVHVENRTARMVVLRLDDILGDGFDDDPDQPDRDGPHQPDADHQPGSAPARAWTPSAPPVVPGLFDGLGLEPGGQITIPDQDHDDPDSIAGAVGAVDDAHHDDHSADDDSADDQSADDDCTDRAAAGVGDPATEEEEEGMRAPTFVTLPWPDDDDTATEPVDSAGEDDLCVVCGGPSGLIAGQRIHRSCAPTGPASPPAEPAPAVADDASTTRPEPVAAATPLPDGHAPMRAPARSAPPSTPGFAAAAAVVDVDGIWCSNGEHRPLPGDPKHVGNLVKLAHWLKLGTQVTKYLPAAGQIWLGHDLARQMGIDVDTIEQAPSADRDSVARDTTRTAPAVTEALAAGYSFGGRDGDSLGRWTRVWMGSAKSVWIVLLPAMSRDSVDVPLLHGDPDHATLARRIGLLATKLGQPYQLSGSTTGLDLMTALRWKDKDRFFASREPIPPALLNVEADLNWCRPPTQEERNHEWVHAYDRSGSYLAGVSGLDLGVGEPTHHPDGTPFVKLPGYWRIEIPATGDVRVPHPLDPRGINAGKTRWVTTPGLQFALEQDYDPPILEAWTWTEKTRIFDPWYERIRDARTALDVDDADAQAARDQLKAIYAPTIGMLGSQIHLAGRPGYAPDRRHHIVAKARTNILRRVARIGVDTGRWPVAIVADTVLYTSPDPDPVASWPGGEQWLGRDLGRYKVEGTACLADQLRYLTGGSYKGKDAMLGRVRGAD